METPDQQAKLQQQIQMLETLLKQNLTKEAITRYYSVKSAHPKIAMQLLSTIANFLQKNQIEEKITDEQLKDILKRISSQKKEFKIHRR